jgi:GDP-L-fucose synthase
MKVLVTGGTGFLGKHLKEKKPDWIYVSSKDFDLTKQHRVKEMFSEIKPDAVIHLAAKTGGIKASVDGQAEFYYLNTMINTNVVHCAYESGVKRMIAALSTCVFPDTVENYPFTERDIFLGPPAITNLSYGYSKRSLFVQINAYREQYGLDYSTFCPSNLYGPGDNFDLSDSHFVAAMIRKCAEAKQNEEIEFWGTGKSLRQQLYIDDLAEIVPLLLKKHHSNVPIIVAPNENLSILEMFELLSNQINKNLKIRFDNNLPGQFRKDGSNNKLLELIGDYNFTKFKDGIYKTYESYNLENYEDKKGEKNV